MNTTMILQPAARFAAENPLMGRLLFLSVELLALSALVLLAIWALRIRAPRVRALLWLLVLAKPVLSLAIGAPLPLFQIDQPEVLQPALSSLSVNSELDLLLERQFEVDRARLAETSTISGNLTLEEYEGLLAAQLGSIEKEVI